MRDVANKVAFITGGVSGIGLGMAKVFSEAGMHVVATYLSDDHRQEAHRLLNYDRPSGVSEVRFVKLDVTDRKAYAEVADEVQQTYGKVHLLCNNAAVGIRGSFKSMEYEDWDWGLGVNFGGVVNGIRVFLPKIASHGEGGHVLTTASMSGLIATPNASVYNASKFALMGLMETLRSELVEENIGVSVACPGLVRTNLHQTVRLRPPKYVHAGVKPLTAEQEAQSKGIMAKGMDVIEYAKKVLVGIQENRLFILTHPEFERGIRDRFEAILRALPSEEPDPERVEVEARYTLRNRIYVD